jgi:hypothetical protein
MLLAVTLLTSCLGASPRAEASCTPGNVLGADFFEDVAKELKDMPVPISNFALAALAEWQRVENTSACWNPLATTRKMPGSWDFNRAGVQNYPDRATGVAATAKALNEGYVKPIQEMLGKQKFDETAITNALNKWSSSGAYVPGLVKKWKELYGAAETGATVNIDIKPGSYPNSINLKSKGVIPVAILTSEDFDATTVDPDTVVFADASPVQYAVEDVDHDGDHDLILHFRTQETNIAPGDTEACLIGETYDGVSIAGCDSVKVIVPPPVTPILMPSLTPDVSVPGAILAGSVAGGLGAVVGATLLVGGLGPRRRED